MGYTAVNCKPEHQQPLRDIIHERVRQDELRDAGRYSDTACDYMRRASRVAGTAHQAFSVLAEEVGEVAQAINEGDLNQVRVELVQVAAVALAMLEGIDAPDIWETGAGR